jgi:hypothetical protein
VLRCACRFRARVGQRKLFGRCTLRGSPPSGYVLISVSFAKPRNADASGGVSRWLSMSSATRVANAPVGICVFAMVPARWSSTCAASASLSSTRARQTWSVASLPAHHHRTRRGLTTFLFRLPLPPSFPYTHMYLKCSQLIDNWIIKSCSCNSCWIVSWMLLEHVLEALVQETEPPCPRVRKEALRKEL